MNLIISTSLRTKITLWISFLLCMLYSTVTAQQSLDQIARSWIATHHNILQKNNQTNLKLVATRSSLAGHTLRYQPTIQGIPVYNAEITIHLSNENKVTYTQDYDIERITFTPNTAKKTIDRDRALTIAKSHLKALTPITTETCELYVYIPEEGKTTLAYIVHIRANAPTGYWEVIIDVNTSAILSAKDIAMHDGAKKHHHSHATTSHHHAHRTNHLHTNVQNSSAFMGQSVNGSGFIFNPDPLSINRVSYGGQYIDNNDADNIVLNAARVAVTLQDIDLTNGVYTLKGPYAEIRDIEIPNKGLFTQTTPNFNFTRSEDGFEAVNCYYHIDTSMRYINETLEIPLTSIYNNGKVIFDPSGLNGEDQSTYGSGILSFGEGGVDDAEDTDIILHELGHGIHDWITEGSLSQIEGLSEGCADYWAQSYSRSLNQWQPSDAAYDYVFNWDGHNEFWDGRVTNVTRAYPDGLVNVVHIDGEIWASALMRIYDIIGREKTDRAFLEGIAMTNRITNQQQAAIAVRQAAIDMNYSIDDIIAFTTEFTRTGYILPELDLEESIVLYPNPTNERIIINGIFNTQETVYITTITGQRVLEQTVTRESNTIDISKLAQGIYLLIFEDLDKQLKFIKE